nr:thrombin inhibitor hemalin-like [Dermacentor andersoni]
MYERFQCINFMKKAAEICQEQRDCMSGPNSETRPARCYTPPESGNCRAYIPTWYFDPKFSKCRVFVYGGCGGNENQFRSEKECQSLCLPSSERRRVCSPKPKRGLCNTHSYFWYFHPGSTTCRRYRHGLCDRGSNKFLSCERCMATCTNMDFRQRCRSLIQSQPGPGGPE